MGSDSEELAMVYGSLELMEPGRQAHPRGLVILIISSLVGTASGFEAGINVPEAADAPQSAKVFPMEVFHT